MKNINEGREGQQNDLKTLELKANLNPEQREYLEVLKDKMKKVLGNKTKQELAKAGDLESLKKYKAILVQILDFLRTKEMTFENEFENETEKQIVSVKIAIQEAMKDKALDEDERGKLLKGLNGQIKGIEGANDIKFKVIPTAEIIFKPEKDFSIDEIFDQIVDKNKEKDLKDKLYVISGSITEDGIITALEIGVAGEPFKIYKFHNVGLVAKIENFEYYSFEKGANYAHGKVAEFDIYDEDWREPLEDEEYDPTWDGVTDIDDEV